jgi:hypothetical protein
MNKLSDDLKIDVAVEPVSLATTNTTGPYYNMKNFRRALFLVSVAAMATGSTVVAQVYQATDATGSDAKVVTNSTITITADTKVKKATITLATLTAGSEIEINGLTFTAHASMTTVASREFSIGGNDTADAAALVTCINDETYGVPGVLASSSAGVVTLTATEPGDNYLTVVGVATIGVAATVYADGFIELESGMLDTANGFTHIALKITTDATIVAGAMLARGDARITPDQYVAASKTDVAS